MKLVRTLLISLLFGLPWLSTFGVVNAPDVRRVCLNYEDSIVTIEWTPLYDACGSFTAFHIYGRSKATDPFVLMGIETDPAATAYQLKIPDPAPTWSFYLEVLNTCDGFDSAASNTVTVDNSPPVMTEIDSVSVDFLSQSTIIGWQPNPSPDAMGYRIYQYGNFGSALGDTDETFYILRNHDINDPINLTVSTYDSCNIPSVFPSAHSIIRLSASIDTCANEISLNWTPYVGWSVSTYAVYVSRDGGPYVQYLTTNSLNYVFSDFTLGEDLCFLIRAYKASSTTTSSSKWICFNTRQPVAPDQLYLSNVTVEGNGLKIEWRDDLVSEIDKFALYRVSPGAPILINETNRTGAVEYSVTDNNVDVNNQEVRYQLVAYDKCNKELASSNQAGNILLTIDGSKLSWNIYSIWLGQTDHQELWVQERSTWNIYANLSASETAYTDETPDSIARCYQIQAIESNNPYNTDKISVSNKVCRIGKLVFYIPNAINPKSDNNRLVIIGNYIDYERTTFSVYNRWGQKIYEATDVRKGWDAKLNEELVPMGIYFYVADIWGINGERQTASGDIRVIR